MLKGVTRSGAQRRALPWVLMATLCAVGIIVSSTGSHAQGFAEALHQPTSLARSSGPILPGSIFGSGADCESSIDLLAPPKVFLGYLIENGAHVFHELRSTGTTLNNLGAVKHYYPEFGFYLGVSEEIRPRESTKLVLEGWWLLSFEGEARSKYVYPWGSPDTESSGITRHWDPKTTGWFVDGAVHFSWMEGAFRNGFSQIAGLRYDHYSKSFEMTLNDSVFDSGTEDGMDVTVSMAVPYIGLQMGRQGHTYEMVFRMIGSPLVFGDLHYGETFGGGGYRNEASWTFDLLRGYWGEIFASGQMQVCDHFSAGAFLKMTTMSLYTEEGTLESTTLGGATTDAGYDLIYRRLIYLVGGQVSARF